MMRRDTGQDITGLDDSLNNNLFLLWLKNKFIIASCMCCYGFMVT